jgi:Terminase large subunit, T4likevirus-type, N-terminal/Terminase RNaseH-like domain
MSDVNNTAYRANILLKRCGVKLEYTEEQLQEYIKCSQDPIYFLTSYVKVVHVDKGEIPFDLYPFQKEMIKTIHQNRRVVGRIGRQSGKSTTTIGYILWATLFNSNYTVAFLANKGSLAIELLDRYQKMYESLPLHLQQGVVYFNRGSVELENGSKVIAAATSSSAIRGNSFAHVVLDEFAHIPNNLAEEFFASVYPVISSGEKTKLTMISTPFGLNLFYKIFTDAKAGRNDYACIDVHWTDVPGRDEKWKDEFIRNTSLRQWQQEIECNFLGSTNTLISGEKLATLTYKEQIGKYSDMVIYEHPVKEAYDNDTGEFLNKDHLYAISVDVSEGKNLDYSAFSVFDISCMPYKQVAIYRNNAIPPMLYPTVIKACAEYYNNAHVLIEINNNPQVASTLIEDLEYENVLKVASGNKRAQTVSLFGGRNVALGLKMSPLVKRIGCSTLKTLIENDKLVINDFETISELTTFVQEGPSYKAEEGCNDDLAMTLVIFSWLATQKYFKEIVEHDIRKQLQLEHFNFSEEEQLPAMEVDDGISVKHFIEDGAVWIETNNPDPYGSILSDMMDF